MDTKPKTAKHIFLAELLLLVIYFAMQYIILTVGGDQRLSIGDLIKIPFLWVSLFYLSIPLIYVIYKTGKRIDLDPTKFKKTIFLDGLMSTVAIYLVASSGNFELWETAPLTAFLGGALPLIIILAASFLYATATYRAHYRPSATLPVSNA